MHVGAMDVRNALGELADAGTATLAEARGNLGLGGAAVLNVGTTPGTVADGGALAAIAAANQVSHLVLRGT
jgi:hypothetical protein